jgi:excinuclease ABC subunit A
MMFKKTMTDWVCDACHGARLLDQRLNVYVSGKNIHEIGEMPIQEAYEFFQTLQTPLEKRTIAEPIIKEILPRLHALADIGLGYLNLNRRAVTLSGGEAQRIRVCHQICSELVGVVYVLDEPSIGLHASDVEKIITMLRNLQSRENTVVVVEHDIDIIQTADDIIELGPRAGQNGGTVIAQGTLETIKHTPGSLLGDYLTGRKAITVPLERRTDTGYSISIHNARENNLKNVDVQIPLGIFVCVTGVSGSGKSSLINEVLYKALDTELHGSPIKPGAHEKIEGIELIDDVVNINQSPIGRHVNSNPATYVGFYDLIRGIYAQLPDAKENGISYANFSFNVSGMRCETCKGTGLLTTSLRFIPDVETVCPDCSGKRFRKELLDVQYHGKNITDVLEMTLEDAENFFVDNRSIARKLRVLNQLGLGYLKVGQSATTLSGGEAQRIKLAAELSKLRTGKHNLYILDEPTTGLHVDDIQKLLLCINALIDAGHSVIVIEHSLDVIKMADYIIDIGPGAGNEGGSIVATGVPEEICAVPHSLTGGVLTKMFNHNRK